MASPQIDEIKNKLDIVEVVSSYVKLQKAGINFRAPCPFHSEKSPSFFVSPTRQTWRCFGCGVGGDVFKFVMEIDGLAFGDALRMLAQRAGVELKRTESAVWQTEKQKLYEICELATKFFERQLKNSKAGKEAKDYLLGRGITEQSIAEWRLGYAPDAWQGLSDFLVGQGYEREEMEKAGLVIKSEKADNYYDRFRGRIMFPVFDLNSQPIGFGGRVFGVKSNEETAKYMNTPNTPLYDKSNILYGLNKSKVEIRKNQNCILMEGYTDVILAYQEGCHNIVAVSGTALTPNHLKLLKRYTETLLTAFDMDVAGNSATKRGIDMAQSMGFNIKVIVMPQGMDPADVVSKQKEKWQGLVEGAKSIMDFYFEIAFGRNDASKPEGKKEVANILLPSIKKIPNKIEQSFWVQQLAKKLDTKEEYINAELENVKLEEEVYGLEPEEIIAIPQKTRRELLEERLAILLVKSPEHLSLVDKEIIFSENTKFVFENLKKGGDALEHADEVENEIKKELSILSAQEYYDYIALKADIEDINEKDIEDEVKICQNELKIFDIKQKLEKISKSIKELEINGNSARIEELTKEFDSYSKTLHNLEVNFLSS